MIFKPMLAGVYNPGTPLTKPMMVSRKIDGIRCLIVDGQAVSRSLKPIPNKRLREVLSNPLLSGLDGELVVGSPTDERAFSATTRGVMSHQGEADVTYSIFDCFVNRDYPFHKRLSEASERVAAARDAGLPVQLVEHRLVHTEAELIAAYESFLAEGWEGAMCRRVDGPWKSGRSTDREQLLLKLKPWRDSEAMILGFDELERNLNEAKTNLLGRTERSTSKEGKVAGGTLGALHVRDIHNGMEFSIGGGFTAADRDLLWAQNERLVGRVVKYKSVIIGVVDAPRFPIFQGFRDQNDMEEA